MTTTNDDLIPGQLDLVEELKRIARYDAELELRWLSKLEEFALLAESA